MSAARTADVVVIGAGLVGMLAALDLAEAGRGVLVLEKSAFWREGSAVNAGTLALQNKPTALLAAYAEALALWDALADRLEAPLGRVVRGGLRLAETDAESELLAAAIDEQRRAGIEVELVQGNRLRAIAPWLGRSVQAAGYCLRDGFANPLLTGEALLRAARRRGIEVLDQCALLGASRQGGAWRLTGTLGVFDCADVLVAAGPWAGAVAAMFGARLDAGLHVNMLSVTPRLAPFMHGLVLTHIGGRLTLKQLPNGTCLLGGGFQGRGDLCTGRKELDLAQLSANLQLHCRVAPRLGHVGLLRSWTGFTAAPPAGSPVIGPLPGAPGVTIAITTGAGFTLGPLVARLASRAVLRGAHQASATPCDPAQKVDPTGAAGQVPRAR